MDRVNIQSIFLTPCYIGKCNRHIFKAEFENFYHKQRVDESDILAMFQKALDLTGKGDSIAKVSREAPADSLELPPPYQVT